MMWEHMHHENRSRFDIDVYITHEETDPADLFQESETLEAIRDGRLAWFMVKVTASRQGLILGADYLGGCCYASPEEFLKGAYYDDMVAEAIQAARMSIAKIKETTDDMEESQ